MDAAQAKKVGAIAGLLLALIVVGREIYIRVTPDPDAQRMNDAADRAYQRLEELKKKQNAPN